MIYFFPFLSFLSLSSLKYTNEQTNKQTNITFYNTIYYISIGSITYLFYLIWIHRDGSAIGTHPRNDLSTLPGGIPLFGNFFSILTDQTPLEGYIREKAARMDKTKAHSSTLPFMRSVDVSDPTSIEYIQKTNFKNYEKGSTVAHNLKDVLGEGIFNSDDEKWVSQRKATSKIFSANSFRGIISHCVDKDLVKLRNIIKEHAGKGEAFDLSQLFFAFTLSSFTSLAFSENVGSLDSSKPIPFATAFDFAQEVLDQRVINPFWPITEMFTESGRKMKIATKVIDDFAYGIIDKREEKTRMRIESGEEEDSEKDLLELYMTMRDEHGQKLGRTALRDATVNLIIAGRDTTAQALSWTFFRLLSDQKHLKIIQKELEEFEVVDYDNFRDIKYTLACFYEGLRLHPSVPKNAYTAKSDDVLPNGTIIKAGEVVLWYDWCMARDPSVWGEDASEFKPSRWIDQEGNLKKESVFKFHSFNGGARLCLGQNLALYEATTVMASLIREFDFNFAPGYLENVEMVDFTATGITEISPRYACSLTLPMKSPFMVTANDRVV